jgi:hypothetical protein
MYVIDCHDVVRKTENPPGLMVCLSFDVSYIANLCLETVWNGTEKLIFTKIETSHANC